MKKERRSLFTYIVFYKPDGVLTAFEDSEGRETIRDYIDLQGIEAAGRLDYDSEGLLLLTDDGKLMHRLTHPSHHGAKCYLVQVEGNITEESIAVLMQGVMVKGEKTQPCRISKIPEPALPPRRSPVLVNGPFSWLQVILQEGKKHQIRHMTAAVGHPTLRLVRVALGPMELGSMHPGEWRHLTSAEVQALIQSAYLLPKEM